MRWHAVNYKAQDDQPSRMLVHCGWWLEDLPRLMLWCRLRGHRPVVDGYGPHKPGLHAARWVACDRCGVRPDPQGNLDPEVYQVGDPYTGPRDLGEVVAVLWAPLVPELRYGTEERPYGPPGDWPDHPTGGIGGELVVGGRVVSGFSFGFEVGNCASDHTLEAHLRLDGLLSVYLHAKRFGTWVQRRFNPTGYDSREVRLAVEDWRVRWSLWARRDHRSRDDPKWMRGSVSLDLVEKVFGPKRYSHQPIGKQVTGVVRLPHGDEHEVRMQLHRERLGRPRLERLARYSWSVNWQTDEPIPTRRGGGGMYGGEVTVTGVLAGGRWQVEALAAIVTRVAELRARNGWVPEGE